MRYSTTCGPWLHLVWGRGSTYNGQTWLAGNSHTYQRALGARGSIHLAFTRYAPRLPSDRDVSASLTQSQLTRRRPAL